MSPLPLHPLAPPPFFSIPSFLFSPLPLHPLSSASLLLPGLPTLCPNKVWKLRKVLNVRVTTGHRLVQAQEVPAGRGHSSHFV